MIQQKDLILNKANPTFDNFDPTIIKYQADVIDDIFFNFDYSKGIHEVLLSGSVGSAKSVLMAHIGIRHCLENSRARLLIGRKSLPDLKDTIFQKICEHLDTPELMQKVKVLNDTSPYIKFINGSEIIYKTWSDTKYKKFRSLELSAAIFEELTENDEDDKEAYIECKMRIGRLPHIKQNFIISATNPDSPSHWVYSYFELEQYA
jgi:PBSX family phage terminase large subunit